MNLNEIKINIQSIFSDNLLVIVGSGLSAGEGLPGMSALADHLLASVPSRISPKHHAEWENIAKLIEDGMGLEQALSARELHEEIHQAISRETSSLISCSEKAVIREVIEGRRNLSFRSLAEVFPPHPSTTAVVTTNYDRLVEIACEATGLFVDSGFVGHSVAKFDPNECKFNSCRGIRKRQNKYYLDHTPRVKVIKPHGSLDWYLLHGRPIRCPYDLNLPSLIISPGDTKYRAGYEQPFDAHRELANQEIDKAKQYLVIGYGFNDDHLQTHLNQNLQDGKTCLIITKHLSPAAIDLLAKCPNILTLTANDHDTDKTDYRHSDGSAHIIRWQSLGIR